MMKQFYLCIVIVLMFLNTKACDICNMFVGINPNDFKNTVSLYYRTRNYSGLIAPDNTSISTQSGLFTNKTSHGGHAIQKASPTYFEEHYNNYQFQGKFYIKNKFQLISSLSISNNTFLNDNVISNWATGLGDLLIAGKYQIHSTIGCGSDKHFSHRLMLGGGIKLPIGNYKIKDRTGIIDYYVQPGTGSLDFLLNGTYLAKIDNIGFNINVSYKANTTNSFKYRFANSFNNYFNLFYLIKNQHLTFMPKVGFYYEQAKRDKANKTSVSATGGKALFGTLGLNIYYKKISMYFTYQNPIYQYLYEVQPLNNSNFILGVSYILTKN